MAEALARGTRDAVQSLYGVLVPPEQSRQQTRRQDSDDSDSQPEYGMQPPPDMAFDSREKLLEYLKNWAASQGYAVVIGRSRTNRLWIRCDRGGVYHDKHQDDPSQRQRKRKISRLTGCEFSVKASMRKDGIWRSRTECGDHNHGSSHDLREHPSLRRMNEEQLQHVYELTEQGMTPADIMTELTRRWPDIKVIRRDIYNARKNYKTIRDSSDQPPREYEDPNGRMPGPTDNGRWAWVEDGDEIKKRRRVGRPPKEQESVATPSASSSNDPYATNVSRPMDVAAQSQDRTASWNRLPTTAPTSQPPAISTQTSSFQPPPTSSSMPNRIRSPQNDLASSSSNFSFAPSNAPAFPQQILTPSMPVDSSHASSPIASGMTTRQSQRQLPQAHIHPSLRSQVGNNGPATPRPEPSAQLANQLQSQLQSTQSQSTNSYMNNAGTPTGTSRPATAGMSMNNDLSGSAILAANGAAQSQAKPSGVAMIQRLSRVEEELRDQKNELRDQKNLLTEILAAVQSLKSGRS